MAKNLSLTLAGEGNLSSKLDEIQEAAGKAATALERAESAVSGINDDMQSAASAAGRLEEKLEEVGQSGGAGAAGVDRLGNKARGATIKASTLNIALDEAADSSINLAGSAGTAAAGVNKMEEEMDEAKGAGLGLAASVGALSGASASGVPIQHMLASSLDETADQADDAAGSMLRAGGAAELLNLQSSALSINLGPFTVALRSLTTQVPLLVASLGNLTAALAGVGGVIGTLGLGGLGVAIGGAVAHAEEIAGPMATMEEKMQAMAAIGKEFMSMMREAIDPLVQLEGSAALFKSLLEEIATTVRVFSEAIADSFRNGPLRNSLAIISDAWMQNIEEIGDAFQGMVDELGPRFANLIADFIAALPGFINWVTKVTDDVMDIFGTLDGVLQPFIVEFTELGRNVAEGLVPVLATFFDVMAGVADVLNEAGGEAVTTAAKIVGLLFAINRLSGILGNIILPLSSVAGSLISVASGADRFSEAFFKATSNFTTFMSEAVSGFGRLATAFTGFLPMVEESGGALGFLATSLEEADEETKTLSQSVKNSLGVFDGMVQRSTLVDRASSKMGDTMDRASEAFGRITTPIRNAMAGMWQYAAAVGAALHPANMFEGATNRMAGAIERTSSLMGTMGGHFETLRDTVISPEFRPTFAGAPGATGVRVEKLTGLRALRQKGQKLAGEIEAGFPATRKRISDTIERFSDGVERKTLGAMTAIGDASDRFAAGVDERITAARNKLGPSFNRFRDRMSEAAERVGSVGRRVGGALYNFGNALNQGFSFATDVRLDASGFDAFFTTLNTQADSLGEATSNVYNSIAGAARRGGARAGAALSEGYQDIRDSIISPEVIRRDAQGQFISPKTLTGLDALGEKFDRLKADVLSSTAEMADTGADNLAGMTADMSEEMDRTQSSLTQKATSIRESITNAIRPRVGDLNMRQTLSVLDTGDIGEDRRVTITGRMKLLGDAAMQRLRTFGGQLRQLRPTTQDVMDSVRSAGRTASDAFTTAMGSAWNQVKRFGGGLIDAGQNVTQFAGRVRSMGPSMQGMADALRSADGSFLRLSNHTGFLTRGFEGLTSRVGTVKQAMLGASVGGRELGDSLSEVRDSARSVVSTTTVSADGVDDLRHQLMVAARTSDMTSDELENFSEELQEMSLSAEVADGTVSELGEELEDAGVDAAVASKLTDSYNEELASTSWRAGIAAKANAALSGSFAGVGATLSTTLLPALGALAAAFAVLVLVGGAVTAILASIGESGKSAEEITRTLKNAFMDLVDAVLPLFLQSAEFVIELVRSITAVFGELVAAGEDVAVALGLMEESTDSGASGFEGFVNSVSGFVQAINPVIDSIGEFIRWTAGYMIIAIRNTADAFIDFINIMHAPSIIQTIIGGAKGIANAIGGIEGVMKGVVNIVGAFISGLIKLTAILAVVGTIAGIAALGVGGFAAALWSAIAGLVTISAPISGTAAAIGALIVAVVAILEYLGVFDIILGVIASAFGLVMDAIMAAVGAIVAAGEAIFNFLQIGKAISFLTSIWDALSAGINKVVNALGVVFNVFGKVFGVIKQMATGIISLLVQKAIGALVNGVKTAWKWLQNLWKSFVNLIMSIPLVSSLFSFLQKGFNKFIEVVSGLVDTILSLPKHITNAFNAVVGHIEGFVNTFIDAVNKIIDGYNSIPGVSDIAKLDDVELTSEGKEAGRAAKKAKESAEEAAPEDANVSEEDATSGFQTAAEMRQRDGEEAPSGETPGRINYQEGDTMNQYNQDISADPEDKAQMSRIAKDAMAEANSFARRQQGGQ